MKVAIYGQKLDAKNIPYLTRFLEYIHECVIEIHIEKNFLDILKSFEIFKNLDLPTFVDHKDLNQGFDLMFTFGGDGTILAAITLIRDLGIHILGVNTGNLGFLASFNKEVFIRKIDSIFHQKFNPIPRSLLWVETSTGDLIPNGFLNFALNEIVVLRRETVSMVTIDAYIDGEFLTSYWADGLIISTPTGSTGYSLSCGGPIITPENKNFVLTPIAPHNLFSRPLIIPDHEQIHLKIHSRAKAYSLSMDTRLNLLSTNTELYIKKASFYAYIIQEEEQNYFKTLQEKLLWGADQRN
ncbi:MAG: NAD kinase [Flavobacteriales bacterium AspAUS03]